MKWETVRNQVGRGVYTVVQELRSPQVINDILLDVIFNPAKDLPKPLAHGKLAKRYAEKAWEVIQNWDIRSAERLRTLFPQYWPPSLRKGKLHAELVDRSDGMDSDWHLVLV